METTNKNNQPNNQESKEQAPAVMPIVDLGLLLFAVLMLLLLLGSAISWVTGVGIIKSCVGVVLFVALVILSSKVRDALED